MVNLELIGIILTVVGRTVKIKRQGGLGEQR